MSRVLIIGVGNPLRGDDGVGPAVVSRLRDRHPEVECLTSLQLHPEHAERMRGRETVLFVDASVVRDRVTLSSVGLPESPRPDGGHTYSPARLLSLCRDLYPDPPGRTLLVEIPARSVEFSEDLDALTARDAEAAELLILDLIPELRTALPAPNAYPGA